MSRNPTHWMAATIRTLLKRVDELERKCQCCFDDRVHGLVSLDRVHSTDPWTSLSCLVGAWTPDYATIAQSQQPIVHEEATQVPQTEDSVADEHVVPHSTLVELCPGFGWTSPSTGISKGYSVSDEHVEILEFNVDTPETNTVAVNENSASEDTAEVNTVTVNEDSASEDFQALEDDSTPLWQLLPDPVREGLEGLEGIGSLATVNLLADIANALSDELAHDPRPGVLRRHIAFVSALSIVRCWDSRYSQLLRDRYEDIVKIFCETAKSTLDTLVAESMDS